MRPARATSLRGRNGCHCLRGRIAAPLWSLCRTALLNRRGRRLSREQIALPWSASAWAQRRRYVSETNLKEWITRVSAPSLSTVGYSASPVFAEWAQQQTSRFQLSRLVTHSALIRVQVSFEKGDIWGQWRHLFPSLSTLRNPVLDWLDGWSLLGTSGTGWKRPACRCRLGCSHGLAAG